MERAEIPPSCNTYYSSCSYAGPSALRRAIKQLTLQSVSSKTPQTRRQFSGPYDSGALRGFGGDNGRQSDPVDARIRLPNSAEPTASALSHPQLLLTARSTRSPHHVPVAFPIKLAQPPAMTEGRRVLAGPRDATTVSDNASCRISCVRQSVSGTTAFQRARSTTDVLLLTRKRQPARIQSETSHNVSSCSYRVATDLERKEKSVSTTFTTPPRRGWMEGSTSLSHGEESFVEEGACLEERRESSVASCSGEDELSEADYCCPEEELTDLEGEEENIEEENTSSLSSKEAACGRGESHQCMERLAEERQGFSETEKLKVIAASHQAVMAPLSSGDVAIAPEHLPSSLITPSLFPDVPPTIHFPQPDEKYIPFSSKERALLKWKMSTITPNVVKHLIAKVGFTTCSKGTSWLGYWGKHMKEEAFHNLKEHQKVNHYPGTFQIGRKDRLWKNLSRMQLRVGKKECDFVPLTFVLPQDLKKLRQEWEKGGTKQRWILKPPAAARGIGIRLACKWSQIPKKKPVIVQKYISNPFLINGSKFDMRVYAYVSSYDPLRIYIFKDGLARFATCKYSSSTKTISNRFMHLTNYSVNKQNSNFVANSDETVCQGHKWGLLALWHYMRTGLGIETEPIWESVKEIVVKTIICSEPVVTSLMRAHVRNSACCHELFGFDIILDRHLKAWILEVNISPSLHSTSQLDLNIKGAMMADLFNIAGFRLPTSEPLQEGKSRLSGLSVEERAKHLQFTRKQLSESERRTILDNLTPDDLRVLMATEDEFARCGSFERVYPSIDSYKYQHFFENERYYNILLEQWILKYHRSPKRGIDLLKRLAK